MQATCKMQEYDGVNISEGIDVNKTSASKECDICHYWYFKDIGYLFVMVAMINEKLWVLMMLLLFMLRDVLTESVFGIWAKMMQLMWWPLLI